MASPDEHTLTFLRGSGFLLSLVGAWDLLADAASPGPSRQGFVLFNETTIIAVLARDEKRPRGIEGTYAVEGNRIILTKLVVDTAPDQGALGDAEFTLEGDILTITWRVTPPTGPSFSYVDTFRRRAEASDGTVLPPVAIYASDGPPATSR